MHQNNAFKRYKINKCNDFSFISVFKIHIILTKIKILNNVRRHRHHRTVLAGDEEVLDTQIA